MKPIHIREVWASNLVYEFKLISSVIKDFPFITIDTEFSGVVEEIDGKGYLQLTEQKDFYRYTKVNGDIMKLIQFGATFTDADGNLPDLASSYCYIWQFNFSGFDIKTDRYLPKSIAMVEEAGINLDKNKADGVDSVKFAKSMFSSGLLRNESVTWITFQGNFDFALLLKILKPEPLPDELSGFSELMKDFFCNKFYDIKHMTRHVNNIYGGLGPMSRRLGINREVGGEHQAGSDSLLAWRVFKMVWSLKFMAQGSLEEQAAVLFRL